MSDSEPVICKRSRPDDITTILIDIVSSLQYKLLAMIFVMFVFISSDVFVNRVLNKFSGAVDVGCPTSWGTLLQGLFLVMGCIAIDAAISQSVI